MKTLFRSTPCTALAILALGCVPGLAAPPNPPAAKLPIPTKADVSYGPHPHQLMDIYLPPDGKGPFPVIVHFGTIWKPGKRAPGMAPYFAAHCALVSVEVRTMEDAVADKVKAPVSYVLLDARRAVQFVRLHAAEYNLDPNRIATTGASQGTLPALYVACAGEKADPNSADPVERVSTKVTCVGAGISQPSIDPKQMQEWVPGVEWGAPALGCTFAESLKNRDRLLPILDQWSPDHLLNKDTPPIFFQNSWGLTKPADVKEMPYKIHSPLWGLGFQKLAESRGATVYVDFPGHPVPQYKDLSDFLIKELTGAAK